MSHSPLKFHTQATAQPSLRRSTVWAPPAETWVYVTPSSKGGMLHVPWKFHPQATAQPSLRRSTVWVPPAETIWEVSPLNPCTGFFFVLVSVGFGLHSRVSLIGWDDDYVHQNARIEITFFGISLEPQICQNVPCYFNRWEGSWKPREQLQMTCEWQPGPRIH